MKHISLGVLIVLAIIMRGCGEEDHFHGRTFKVIDSTNFLETRTEFVSEEENGEMISLTFDSGEVIFNSAKHLKGEYTAVDDRLEITLADHKGELLLVFSDLASSVEKDVKYTAEISTVDYSLDTYGELAELELIEMYDREGMVVFFEEMEE